MLAKNLKVEEVRKRLKKLIVNRSGDPRITIQIFEREALYELFREVYNEGIQEGRRVEKKILAKKVRSIL